MAIFGFCEKLFSKIRKWYSHEGYLFLQVRRVPCSVSRIVGWIHPPNSICIVVELSWSICNGHIRLVHQKCAGRLSRTESTFSSQRFCRMLGNKGSGSSIILPLVLGTFRVLHSKLNHVTLCWYRTRKGVLIHPPFCDAQAFTRIYWHVPCALEHAVEGRSLSHISPPDLRREWDPRCWLAFLFVFCYI